MSTTVDHPYSAADIFSFCQVTATAGGAGGSWGGGTWTQRTSNFDSLTYGASAGQWGDGFTTAGFDASQPYTAGSAAQPVQGKRQQTASYTVSYNYNTASIGGNKVESRGSLNNSYTGSGNGTSAGTPWRESEQGGNTISYDNSDTFNYSSGVWSMSGGTAKSSGSGNTYQWQIVASNAASVVPPAAGSPPPGGATNSYVTQTQGVTPPSGSTPGQFSLAATSYSCQQQAGWTLGGGGGNWGTPSGSQTVANSGWSNSCTSTSGGYSIPSSAGVPPLGGSSGSTPPKGGTPTGSPFSVSGASIQYSGGGTQSQSASDYAAYNSSGVYSLGSDGSWNPVSGNGWSVGVGSASSSYSGGGTYSCTMSGGSVGNGLCAVPSGSVYGFVSGGFTESGGSDSSYAYATSATLGNSGWNYTNGWQWTNSCSNSTQSNSGGGTFNILPSPAGGGAGGEGLNAQTWTCNGTTSESGGQTSNNSQSASFTLTTSGGWQQVSGGGTNSSDVSQSSSQAGYYQHAVNGVTLAGAFSQSNSQDDNSSYTNGGSVSGGQWVPSGSGGETISNSSSYSSSGDSSPSGVRLVVPPSGGPPAAPAGGTPYSGGGNATGSVNGWNSSGTETESQNASASADHTIYYSLGADGIWQAVSGSGTTSGSQSTSAGYSGGGSYSASPSGGWGSVQGGFTQEQDQTVAWSFSTNDDLELPSPAVGSAYWQPSGGSGSTSDAGGSGFTYSGGGQYNGFAGGTMSQSGGAQETFSYTKSYYPSSGGWVASGGSGGASGSGGTSSSYSGGGASYPTLPQFAASAVGLSVVWLSGGGSQSGGNSTSYSFHTSAVFNGVDWGETGNKSSSGGGSASQSYQNAVPGGGSGTISFLTPYGAASGTASASGSSGTSFSYTEYAFLDDNGTWQTASGGSGSFTASGGQNWSLSGSGNGCGYQTTLYGNSASGTSNSVSGGGSDSYNYTQNYNLSPAGQWQAVSGGGTASGGGSITFGYSANGGYSTLDPNWQSASLNSAATQWSGGTSASGSASVGCSYSIDSSYSSGGGWTSSGTSTATASGGTSSQFSASSPFSICMANGTTTSGTASGGGSDWSGYSYAETENLGTGVYSGGGGSSGGCTATWSYSGGGSYVEGPSGGTISGTLGESGGRTYTLGYSTSAAVPTNGTTLVTQSGSGSVTASANCGYSYSGGGSGGSSWSDGAGNTSSNSWDFHEHGGGSGTRSYSNPLSLQNGEWTWGSTPTLSIGTTAAVAYSDDASSSYYSPTSGGGDSHTIVTDDEITNTGSAATGGADPTYGGSGSVQHADDSYDAGQADPGLPAPLPTIASWSAPGDTFPLPTYWSAYGGSGPAPGGAVSDVITTCGINLPANMSSTTAPLPAVAGLPTNPAFPLFGTPTLPGSLANMLPAGKQVSSLVGLASWPGAVDAVWGMAFEGQAAAAVNASGSAWLGNAAAQTLLALGNLSGSSAAFTAEKIRGADAVFGAYPVSPAVPVTQAGNDMGYGLKGVGAGANAAGAAGATGAIGAPGAAGALGAVPTTPTASQASSDPYSIFNAYLNNISPPSTAGFLVLPGRPVSAQAAASAAVDKMNTIAKYRERFLAAANRELAALQKARDAALQRFYQSGMSVSDSAKLDAELHRLEFKAGTLHMMADSLANNYRRATWAALHATAGARDALGELHEAPVPDEVADLTPNERMWLAVSRAGAQIPSSLYAKFAELFTPTNLAIMCGAGVVLVGAHFIGIGFIIDGIGIAWIGADSVLTLADLCSAIADARAAVNNAQINIAAARIAQDFSELVRTAALTGAGWGAGKAGRAGARWLNGRRVTFPEVPIEPETPPIRAPEVPPARPPEMPPEAPPLPGDRVYPAGERGGRPFGRRSTNLPNADSGFKRGIAVENLSADELAKGGYRVEQNPPPPPGSNAHPDFLIEGQYFDNYAPKASTSARAIVNAINEKVATQAQRIVLNLAESNVSRHELREAIRLYGSTGLKELIVIDKFGNIIRFFP